MILAAALALGGAIGAISQFVLVKGLWVWDMPDLAHRFLAAAASAYVVGGAIVLMRRRREEAELLAATVLIYGYPLVAAILIDAGDVDWGRPIAWMFVLIVTPAVIVGTVYLLRARRAPAAAGEAPASAPGGGATRPDPRTRALLVFLALAAGIVGVLVFLAPRDVNVIWPWGELPAWKLIDHRLLASMLLTVAGGALLALRRPDAGATRLLLAMVVAYCVVAAVGLAMHSADAPSFAGKDRVYIVVLSIVALWAAWLLSPRDHGGDRDNDSDTAVSARASAP